ncbi:putative heavy-metal-binding-domain-containing protein [Paraphoma chrysanthemicola]|uniref:Heavy-metal-binding-domain-containing protein n=1 Tax=Paraphoma chrysanthemicola TaxID=798071 RepID=A0A8K0QZF5_9PLEO|nr:putative heavy-metal-binding-domain-containing protein [Paraphoma chrysanthemicola]
MLTNRRSTMMVPPSRMPSWHPQSKPYPQSQSVGPLAFDTEILPSRTTSLITSTTATLPGHRILRVVGAVHGTTTSARKDTKSFMKNLANSFGSNWGEPKSVTSLIYQTRDQAIDRLVKEAIGKGANAIIGVEVRESEILGCVVVSVSGTACWVEKERPVKRDSAQDDPFV